jgi:hypothetical protein
MRSWFCGVLCHVCVSSSGSTVPVLRGFFMTDRCKSVRAQRKGRGHHHLTASFAASSRNVAGEWDHV